MNLSEAKDVQLARIAHRQETTPHQTFPMSEADLDTWREQFQEPAAAELDSSEIPTPPAGWPSWPDSTPHRLPCTSSLEVDAGLFLLRRWAQGGVEALRRRPATGRPPKLDDAQVKLVRTALEQGAQAHGACRTRPAPERLHRARGTATADGLALLASWAAGQERLATEIQALS
ncbi:hypothetical protein ACFQ10_51815 [Streptomyces indonesiensis]